MLESSSLAAVPADGIQHPISELDLAIRDIRDVVFDSRRAGSPAAGKPG